MSNPTLPPPEDVLAGPAVALPPTNADLRTLSAAEIADLGPQGLPVDLRHAYPDADVYRVANEAVLYLATDAANSRQVIIKRYLDGLRRDVAAMERLTSVDIDHVLRIDDFRRDGLDPYFEVVEYVERGSLASWIASEPSRRLSTADVYDVVSEIAGALQAIHAEQVTHLDLKPDNVLVRTRSPLDLVLADFGLATVHVDRQHAPGVGTIPYLAPESLQGFGSVPSDWWALGTIVLEASTGALPWAGLTAKEMASRITHTRADVSGVTDYRVRLLCQGLLTRNDSERWGAVEVNRWLAHSDPALGTEWTDPEPVERVEIREVRVPVEVLVPAAPVEPYTLAGVPYDDPRLLAAALVDSDVAWNAGLRVVAGEASSRLLVRWLTDMTTSSDTRLASGLDDITTSRSAPAVRLVRVVCLIQPDLVDQALGQLASRALSNLGGAEADSVGAPGFETELRRLGKRGEAVAATWRPAVDAWVALHGEHEDPSQDTRRFAQATILQCAIDPTVRADVERAAKNAASSAALIQPWFARLTKRKDLASAVAVITLSGLAARTTAEDAAARQIAARQAAADQLVAAGRTRSWLGRTLVYLVALAAAGAIGWWLTRAAMHDSGAPGQTDVFDMWQWAQQLPPWVLSWVALALNPLVTWPLVAIGVVLMARSAPQPGPSAAQVRLPKHIRHPLERRAMQAVILAAALLVPVFLIPVVLNTWPRRPGTSAPGVTAPRRVARPRQARWQASVAVFIGATAFSYLGIWWAFVIAYWLTHGSLDPSRIDDVFAPSDLYWIAAITVATVALTAATDVVWFGGFMRWYLALALQVWFWGVVGLKVGSDAAQGEVRPAAPVVVGVVAAIAWLAARRVFWYLRDRPRATAAVAAAVTEPEG